jgi:hypothetical protein
MKRAKLIIKLRRLELDILRQIDRTKPAARRIAKLIAKIERKQKGKPKNVPIPTIRNSSGGTSTL